MRSSCSWAWIETAIFSPIPGVSAICSGVAAISVSMSRIRWTRLRAVTSPTSSIPSANRTLAKGRSLEASIAASSLRAEISAKPVEAQQLLLGEAVEVRGGVQQAPFLQQRHVLLAEALDVHRPARDEVLEQLPLAAGADGVGAVA